jgi:ABC-type glycerol-3-phosphate transport system substrate-binding protein
MKKQKNVLALGLLVCGITALSSCGKTTQIVSGDKTVIAMEIWAGGFGTEWLNTAISEWNAKEGNTYQVVLGTPNLSSADTVITQINGGINKSDIIFSCEPYFQTEFNKDNGAFQDLTPVLDLKPDGASGKSIRDKILNFDAWAVAAGKRGVAGNGFYMLPATTTITGPVFDFDFFLEQSLDALKNGNDPWLHFASVNEQAALTAAGITTSVEKVGATSLLKFVSSASGKTTYDYSVKEREGKSQYILTAGADGAYGTYDDGEPQTLDEWDTMLDLIKAEGYNDFLYSGYSPEYVDSGIVQSYLGQYLGPDAFHQLMTYDSKGAKVALNNSDGTKGSAVLAIDNGYQAYSAEGIDEAVDFASKYFHTTDYTTTGVMRGTSRVDACQTTFLQSYQASNDKKFAMIVEGNWWENEARSTFNALASKNLNRGYGEREYRFMELPYIEGQKGLDGQGNGRVLGAQEQGGLVVQKQSDEGKKAAVFDFLAYLESDHVLSNTLASSGLLRPYSFTPTDEDYAKCTPFVKNVYSMFNDTTHFQPLAVPLAQVATPLFYATTDFYKVVIPYGQYAKLMNALNYDSTDTVKSNIKAYYSKDKWASIVAQARKNGYFA